jgi:hypothetical protein
MTSHSITSSARVRSKGEMSRPMALAVFRLIANPGWLMASTVIEQLEWFLQLSPSRARQTMLQFPDPRRSDDAPYVSLELAASAVVDAEGTSETALAVLAADLAGNLLKIKAVRRSQARDIDFRRGGKQGRAGGAPSLRLAWPLRGEAQAPNHRPR